MKSISIFFCLFCLTACGGIKRRELNLAYVELGVCIDDAINITPKLTNVGKIQAFIIKDKLSIY